MIYTDERLLDFRNVLYVAFQKLGLDSPTPLQYDMANVIQNLMKPTMGLEADPDFLEQYPMLRDEKTGGPAKKVLLQAYRGIGKSLIGGCASDWALGVNQSLNVMAVSASERRATMFTTFCLRLIKDLEIFQPLEPDTHKGHRNSALQFDVNGSPIMQMPSVLSAGITGQIVGNRSDVLFGDDVEVPTNSATQAMREQLAEATKEFTNIGKPGDIKIALGTPQSAESVYLALQDRGWAKIVWPSRYPSDAWMEANGEHLAPIVRQQMEKDRSLRVGYGLDGRRGATTDPHRFTEEVLVEKELELGRSTYDLQFQLDTSLSDAENYPLKLSDLIVMDLEPDMAPGRPIWAGSKDLQLQLPNPGFRGDRFHRPMQITGDPAPYSSIVMSIDPSGRGKDELAYAVVAQHQGFLYLLDCGGYRGEGYSEPVLRKLAHIAEKFSVSKIITEPNFGGGMFTQLLKPVLADVYPCSVEDAEWSTSQKEARIIQTIEPVLNAHRLVVDQRVIRKDAMPHDGEDAERAAERPLFRQLTHITYAKGCLRHDDRLDALAIAISYWNRAMAQDPDKRYREAEMRLWEARMKETGGCRAILKDGKRPPRKANWLGR